MFEENENLVLEDTENVEETTEETEGIEQVDEPSIDKPTSEEPEKLYTEDDFNKKLDEVLAKKIARKEARIRKEYDKKYGRLESVLRAGTGIEGDADEIADTFNSYYSEKVKGYKAPTEPTYSERDTELLARVEADDIISSGFDEVVEEVDRLAEIGVENMTPREKLVFTKLAEYRKAESGRKELASIGVKGDVYDSKEFKDFAEQFTTDTPIKTVYELYTKTIDKPTPEKIGSMKNGDTREEKTYYSPEDVDKLTPEELDDPNIFKRVHESMAKWK